MAGERLENRDKVSIRRRLAQIAGANILAITLLVPSTQTLAESESAPSFAAGPIHEALQPSPPPPETAGTYRDTGLDSQACRDFEVCGTDLGIPFLLPPDKDGKRSVGYLFGDTFIVAGPFLDIPSGLDHYRPQVLLRSDMTPEPNQPILFDGAAGIDRTGTAPELLHHGHLITNDGISLPNGDIILSYQGMMDIKPDEPIPATWKTDQSGLAVSHDGGNTFELAGPIWRNDANDSDPYQMSSMERDGDYVYTVSVRAGRQPGPMMLTRVRWDHMLDQDGEANPTKYEYWNGTSWGTVEQAEPVLNGIIGEPSLRKLSDGTWVMAYTEYTGGAKIVTRSSQTLEGLWTTSQPKVQLTWQQLPSLYGGFVHPYSTAENLILMVSTWQTAPDGSKHGKLIRYDVSHFNGKL